MFMELIWIDFMLGGYVLWGGVTHIVGQLSKNMAHYFLGLTELCNGSGILGPQYFQAA